MDSQEFWNNPDAKKMLKAMKFFFIVIAILVLAVLLGFFVMFLWNATMVPIFGVPEISYWQAVGLFLLAKMFFGFGGSSSSKGRKAGKKGRYIKEKVEERAREYRFANDDSFKEFWAGEGKAAYEAYLASRDESNTEKD